MDIVLGSAALSLPAVGVSVLSRASRASRASRVEALGQLQRARAWADGLEQRLLAALGEPGDAPSGRRVSAAVAAKQYVREEIACALQVSPSTVNDKLHTARMLVAELPATLAAVEAGEVSMRHARVLVDAVSPLAAAARVEVQNRVLGRARCQTPTRFRQSVARAVAAVYPRGADERHETAYAERQVSTRMQADAMGSLQAVVSAPDLAAVREVVQAAADAHPEHDEQCTRTVGGRGVAAVPDPGCVGCCSRARTADQRRADAFVGLLLGLDLDAVATRHGRAPSVQVSVALSTLLDLDDQPGELDGYGPVPAEVARRMAGDSSGTWRRLVTDPMGHLVDYGRSTYRPPQDLSDHVIARDRYCRFPGCGRQARSCELDHLLDWDLGGHTNEHNLLSGCPRHHHLRHDAGWRVGGDPSGTLTWVTPTGRAYDDPIAEHPIDTTTSTTCSSEIIDDTRSSETAKTAKIKTRGDLDPPPF